MEIRQIQSFVAIVEEGSFIKAANRLNYAQSSVTAHIQAIEEFYGQPVFDRIGKKVVLNAFGSLVYQHARGFLAGYNDLLGLKNQLGEPAGTIRLGVTESTMLYRLAPVVQEYKRRFPKVDIVMQNSLCPVMRRSLRDGSLDIALLLEPEGEGPDIVCRTLMEEPMSIVLPLQYPKEELDDSYGYPILFTEQGCSYRRVFEAYLNERGIRSGNMIETASVEVIKQYVLCDSGISFLPTVVIRKELEAGLLKHLPWKSEAPVSLRIAHHKDKWLSPAMSAFIECVQVASDGWKSDADCANNQFESVKK